MAGRFLFPTGEERAWLFVADVASIEPGAAVPFESPSGVRVMITRRCAADAGKPPTADDFLALSSVCPHLGCRVHWEPHNDRFFCPCHNGVFDVAGQPKSGPPADANTPLPQYPLTVIDGVLYIEMATSSVLKRT